jgi:hypothetical protein
MQLCSYAAQQQNGDNANMYLLSGDNWLSFGANTMKFDAVTGLN